MSWKLFAETVMPLQILGQRAHSDRRLAHHIRNPARES